MPTNTTNQNTQFQPPQQLLDLNNLLMEQIQSSSGQPTEIQQNSLNLVNQLLTGGALPGAYQGLYGGITPEMTNEMAQHSVNNIVPGLQQSGILDSGTSASIQARTAGDIRRQSAEFNVTNLNQLLGMGIEGQESVQRPIMEQQRLNQQQQQMLSNNLLGITGQATSKDVENNPYENVSDTLMNAGLGAISDWLLGNNGGNGGAGTSGLNQIGQGVSNFLPGLGVASNAASTGFAGGGTTGGTSIGVGNTGASTLGASGTGAGSGGLSAGGLATTALAVGGVATVVNKIYQNMKGGRVNVDEAQAMEKANSWLGDNHGMDYTVASIAALFKGQSGMEEKNFDEHMQNIGKFDEALNKTGVGGATKDYDRQIGEIVQRGLPHYEELEEMVKLLGDEAYQDWAQSGPLSGGDKPYILLPDRNNPGEYKWREYMHEWDDNLKKGYASEQKEQRAKATVNAQALEDDPFSSFSF